MVSDDGIPVNRANRGEGNTQSGFAIRVGKNGGEFLGVVRGGGIEGGIEGGYTWVGAVALAGGGRHTTQLLVLRTSRVLRGQFVNQEILLVPFFRM